VVAFLKKFSLSLSFALPLFLSKIVLPTLTAFRQREDCEQKAPFMFSPPDNSKMLDSIVLFINHYLKKLSQFFGGRGGGGGGGLGVI
jgi:hypothetical protein